MKIGRNDKCPCGSGKKFKHCCGKSDSKSTSTAATTVKMPRITRPANHSESPDTPLLPPQLYQLIIARFIEGNSFNLNVEKHRYARHLAQQANRQESDDTGFLSQYILLAEKEIETIASEHTVFELLYWSRRFGPHNIFNVDETSVHLYRDIQTLAIYKYGRTHEDPMIWNNQLLPRSMGELVRLKSLQDLINRLKKEIPQKIEKELTAVLRIELLSYLLLKATQNYRMVNKGGRLAIDKTTGELISHIPEDKEFLIDLYDSRLKKINLMSDAGAYIPYNTDTENDPYVILAASVNVDHKEKIPLIRLPGEEYDKLFRKNQNSNEKLNYTPNYIYGAFGVQHIRKYLSLFESEFTTHYGFTPGAFTLFFSYWGFQLFGRMAINPYTQTEAFNRGYIIIRYDADKFAEEFETLYQKELSEYFPEGNDVKSSFKKMFDTFLLTENNRKEICLWTRGPKKLFHKISDNFLTVDYTTIPYVIENMAIHFSKLDGDIGNRRAADFEIQLVEKLRGEYGPEKLWQCRHRIEANGRNKEIDASFFNGDILFLLEAKAINNSFAFERGDKKALDYRQRRMTAALKEVDDKAAFIRDNHTDLIQQLPSEVKWICPIVVSAFPEYIWENTDNLFISRKMQLPRIITINDIPSLRDIPRHELLSSKWIVPL